MRNLLTCAAPIALLATPAFAGEEVLFGEGPGWTVESDFDAALAANEDIVLYDRQLRLEDGAVMNLGFRAASKILVQPG